MQTDPTRFASGGDDGTVRLWSMREYASTATIDTKANVCSVQLSPHNANLLAFGSANYRVYLYDLRKVPLPPTFLQLRGVLMQAKVPEKIMGAVSLSLSLSSCRSQYKLAI